MIALPSFAPMALEQTYQHFDDLLSFANTEQWITGEIGLFLNALNVLDLNSLDKSITAHNRAGINEVFQLGLNEWAQSLDRFEDEDQNTLTLILGIETDYYDKERKKLRLSIESTPYAYDIRPLSFLSDNDRKVVVRCIAEIRAIFLYCPNVTDLKDFAGYRMENFEYLDDWLPSKVKKGGSSAIESYIEDNQDSFETFEYDDIDEMILEYLDYLKPMPKWVSELDKGAGESDPFSALGKLKLLRGKSTRPDVNSLLENTIQSVSDFLSSFTDLKSWSDFKNASYELSNGIETDHPAVDLGYMLAWGSDGFWWDIQSDVFNSMMEAGEVPTFYGWAYGHHTKTVQLAAERIYRGAALLTQMASITAGIEQSLPESESVDNEIKEDRK